MYKLYNVKTWGSLAIHCLLEEMEAPYTNIWMTAEQVRAADFCAISNIGYDAPIYVPGDASQQAIKAKVHHKVDGCWALDENRLASAGPWLMGRDFSAIDIDAFMMTIWGAPSEQAVLDSHGVLKVGGFAG